MTLPGNSDRLACQSLSPLVFAGFLVPPSQALIETCDTFGTEIKGSPKVPAASALSSLSAGNWLNRPKESTSMGCELQRSLIRVVRARAPNILIKLAGGLACEKRAA